MSTNMASSMVIGGESVPADLEGELMFYGITSDDGLVLRYGPDPNDEMWYGAPP
jgi:hypothetical protein